MDILERRIRQETVVAEDGSTHAAVEAVVRVRDDRGDVHELRFLREPTDQEILDAVPRPAALVATRRDDIEMLVVSRMYGMFVMWRDIAAEAQARGEPTLLVTAARTRADSLWLALKQALTNWRNAT